MVCARASRTSCDCSVNSRCVPPSMFPLGRDYAGRSPLSAWRTRRRRGWRRWPMARCWLRRCSGREGAALISAARETARGRPVRTVAPALGAQAGACGPRLDTAAVCRPVVGLPGHRRRGAGCTATPDWQVHPALLGRLSPRATVFVDDARPVSLLPRPSGCAFGDSRDPDHAADGGRNAAPAGVTADVCA